MKIKIKENLQIIKSGRAFLLQEYKEQFDKNNLGKGFDWINISGYYSSLLDVLLTLKKINHLDYSCKLKNIKSYITNFIDSNNFDKYDNFEILLTRDFKIIRLDKYNISFSTYRQVGDEYKWSVDGGFYSTVDISINSTLSSIIEVDKTYDNFEEFLQNIDNIFRDIKDNIKIDYIKKDVEFEDED